MSVIWVCVVVFFKCSIDFNNADSPWFWLLAYISSHLLFMPEAFPVSKPFSQFVLCYSSSGFYGIWHREPLLSRYIMAQSMILKQGCTETTGNITAGNLLYWFLKVSLRNAAGPKSLLKLQLLEKPRVDVCFPLSSYPSPCDLWGRPRLGGQPHRALGGNGGWESGWEAVEGLGFANGIPLMSSLGLGTPGPTAPGTDLVTGLKKKLKGIDYLPFSK